MITKEIDNFDITFGIIADFQAKNLGVEIRDFELHHYADHHDHYLLVAKDGTVMGEFTFAKDFERKNSLYEHTAHLHKSLRGQGLYLDVLLAVRKLTKKAIISYPFDPDSDQERSEMNNRFWAKNGIVIDDEDGLTYKLK